MSLKDYSREQIEDMSMLELASVILKDERKALEFQELFKRIADIKGLTQEEKEDYIAQFYTDLNVDGRFTTLGSNMWGLKRWYPIEQADEEVHTPKKKKKKKATKKKKRVAEEIPEVEEDVFDEEDLHEDDLDDDLDDLEDDDLEDDLDDDELEDYNDFDDDDELEEEDIDEEFDDDEDDVDSDDKEEK
ncbi:DNA-directed RNA polymerase subunit delta [Oceanobacillus halophilus]|uniref:Probable DNA-directed RNA polymerase subunit delta n=1 Tax=Oceanobacillus halophilus TaxID=930130 RepID=A0A495A1E9_9BACI|nr:DNA-directed RNA polymerase subunit delta [Oceanobacillus halophilus]RKQ31552.1 DNA-directed RNA polymerase subunit delta [Oceanobacillus halophilus]